MEDVPTEQLVDTVSTNQTQTQSAKRRAIALLWSKGILTWKLTPVQKDLYNSYKNAKLKTIVWSASRRIGKSYALCTIAIEKCIQKPNCIIKYIAPTQKQVKSIIKPIFKEVLKDCPKELRPKFKPADNVYAFPNGSEVQLAGTDAGHAEGLRGGNSDLCIVDEAGFCDDLRYIVQSILIPTTTTTRGKIILSSTPPKTPDHEFNDYIKSAKYKGNYVKKTIYDGLGGKITQEYIDDIIEEYGGVTSIEFRREYLCEDIIDDEHSVVAEFDKDVQEICIREWKRPPFCDRYVGGDIGFKDFTVFLFGYYDFRMAKVVIEDELVMRGTKMNTEALANEIKKKESGLWSNPQTGEVQAPYLRVCDNNLIVINDLRTLHGITFQPTAKDDADAALNNMKVMIKQRKIIINPRCKTLIFHLQNAVWAKNRKTYARAPDMGHYDAVDALKYFVRNIHFSKNPYPANYGMGSGDDWWGGFGEKPLTQTEKFIKDLFALKSSIKRINK